ncbi:MULTISPECIES: hypothetical protein [Pseudoalteromonas]|uniref:Uncharacterized protein n=1 Tax=Pseudoalteromonas amylolytica TaxID=1859457 RepID=A0A1S1MZP2_9GAMM|nr:MULTISPECIES: hypothetical protein [Pseudoalteromonas]OHU87816.1 hypothetical protein BFC16_10405 [Pseudoalteromonas sp. JW3]OHU91256.1 hypothetical protein BET10_10525 [Pseudoalteromonas amylolytica]
MSTIEQQIQALNATNAELATKSNALTQAVQTQVTRIEQAVSDAKIDMSSATTTVLNKVKADAAQVNAEIENRMDAAIKPWMPAMSKVQFEALREQRAQQYAGSGFVEWGRHNRGTATENVNIGIWQYISPNCVNTLLMGEAASNSHDGTSSALYPKVLVSNVLHHVSRVAHSSTQNHIRFPSAPDGTKTYDTATGTVTQHDTSEDAFMAETSTNKVVTTRKDLVFLETWHEDISDKDIVYPLGNVQYGIGNYNGITLSNNKVAQSYSAFGEWDTATQGNGAKWSSLSDEQKTVFLAQPEHNIYYDPHANALIQVRYRIRVVEGYSDHWNDVRPAVPEVTTEWALAGRKRIAYVQGSSATVSKTVFVKKSHNQTLLSSDDLGIAEGEGQTMGVSSHSGTKPMAVPIALVQRLNQGAYHPVFNPMGTAQFTQTNVANYHWNTLPANYYPSRAGCFELPSASRIGRHVNYASVTSGQTGRPSRYKYHDTIYAGLVEDLRLDANKLEPMRLMEDTMSKAVTGALRGKGCVPYTLINTDFCHDSEMTIYIDVNNNVNPNPLTKNLPLFNRAKYFSYADTQKFDIPTVLIKFLDYGDTDLGSYAGGHPLDTWVKVDRACLLNSRTHIALINPNNGNANWIDTGRASTIKAQIIVPTDYQGCEFESLPYVDIIGDPDKVVELFPQGVIGQWNPNHVPDGSGERFALNRKAISGDNDLVTFYNGEQWETSTNAMNLVAQSNTISHPTVFAQDNVALYFYDSKADSTVSAALGKIESLSGKVWCGNDARASFGAYLQTSLTGKVPTSISYTTNAFVPVTKVNLLAGMLVRDEAPEHEVLPHLGGTLDNAGCKALYSLTAKNGLYYLQFNGSELKLDSVEPIEINSTNLTMDMVKGSVYFVKNNAGTSAMDGQYWYCNTSSTVNWNADIWVKQPNGRVGVKGLDRNEYLIPYEPTSWGDDKRITLLDGENVKTDFNGNSVSAFCHHTLFPIGIASN